MEVIRSNYSTLSPYAQVEAPSAPEFPFTDIMEAYRGTLKESKEEEEKNATEPYHMAYSSAYSSSSSAASNQTISFQRILQHFFDDYFQEDADEETASDMAQRWVAFARSGDPNYADSKIEWMPWRYIPKSPQIS